MGLAAPHLRFYCPDGGTTNMVKNATLSAFKASIVKDGIDAAVATYLMDRVPFVFGDDRELYRVWKRKLANLIEIDPLNITIIGSGAVGFSLNPYKDFKVFSETSDIDVAVVSDYHFSVAWRALRATKLPDVRKAKDREAIKDHRSKYIYWGCIATDKVLGYLPFVRQWTEATSLMSAEKPTEERDIKIRLYRDYESLRSYHMNGLETLLSTLMEK
ncbi:hypothetical protein RFM41_11200 [Mesorhizobium sp. VK25A]|uniref:Nucleotidyltransferase n=1 Tax=Mesorhizobium vachelliae TaxID=3072309 RepID=A0ABU4ZX02_9HYPH|nr:MULTISPECIES: hypothetical protein [unclassified Mesorhizobium]MDX8529908.1 hypothetical protein [Mesorhizobium sp. VK25D]MDX8544306.1 hypothetical protein [Mesorhizobium sp. VK25A]